MALELLEDRTAPAALVVNTLDDTPAVNPNLNAFDANGHVSLRSAIQYENVNGNNDQTNTITFDPGNTRQGIPPLTGTISLSSVLDTISTNNLTITGPSMTGIVVARSTAAGTPNFGIFSIAQGTTCTINSLSVVNGLAGSGGGIQNNGWLSLNNVDVHNTSTVTGGGIYNAAQATLTVTSCQIWENFAGALRDGGGITNDGTAYVNSSQISLNTATDGGGIFNTGSLSVGSTQVYSNSAVDGGGIFNSGIITISGGSLSGNTASGLTGRGGGIFNESSNAPQLTNVTVSGNSAIRGGGFFVDVDTCIVLQGCTFTGNSASTAGNAGFCANAAANWINDGGNTFAPGQDVVRPPQ